MGKRYLAFNPRTKAVQIGNETIPAAGFSRFLDRDEVDFLLPELQGDDMRLSYGLYWERKDQRSPVIADEEALVRDVQALGPGECADSGRVPVKIRGNFFQLESLYG